MRPAMPRICSLCGREVFGLLGLSVHRRRMHGPHYGNVSYPEPDVAIPPPPPNKRIAAYRARWKKDQAAAVRRIRPDIHERFQMILDRIR